MFAELTITEFLGEVGSKKPAPGGGSVSALAGSLASSLVKMVANLSGEAEQAILPNANKLAEQLLHLVTKDTEAFNQVVSAYKLPRNTEENKRLRSTAIQSAIQLATEVPLEILESSFQVLILAKEMAYYGNQNTISDTGVAGLLAAAACKGAAYNVLINLPTLKSPEFVAMAKTRLTERLEAVEEMEREIAKQIFKILG